jgi:hypothetical protein
LCSPYSWRHGFELFRFIVLADAVEEFDGLVALGFGGEELHCSEVTKRTMRQSTNEITAVFLYRGLGGTSNGRAGNDHAIR